MHEPLEESHECKAKSAAAEPDAWRKTLEEDIGGNLEEDIGYEEYGQDRIIASAM